MPLPLFVLSALEREASRFRTGELAKAYRLVSSAYREAAALSVPAGEGRSSPGSPLNAPPMRQAERLAYCAARMPATFAALQMALGDLRDIASHIAEIEAAAPISASAPSSPKSTQSWRQWKPSSLLDLGAGPGTAYWAALEFFPGLKDAVLLERDPGWIEWAGAVFAGAFARRKCALQWREEDISASIEFPERDLVILSYSLNELSPAAQEKTAARAWKSARKFLLILEPGSPKGFDSILHARERVIHLGASILGPCPHAGPCPLADCARRILAGRSSAPSRSCLGYDSNSRARESGSPPGWCHFSRRLERNSIHRRLKSGELGYEDEKFSYLIATRLPVPESFQYSRILSAPLVLKGEAILSLCTPGGLSLFNAPRRDKTLYASARECLGGEILTE